MRAQWLVAILAVGLGGCGGSSSSSSAPQPKVPDNSIDYTQLKPSEPSEAPLALLSGDDFERLVKNGLRLQLASRYDYADRAESDCARAFATFEHRVFERVSAVRKNSIGAAHVTNGPATACGFAHCSEPKFWAACMRVAFCRTLTRARIDRRGS